jgi:hypothetical protein
VLYHAVLALEHSVEIQQFNKFLFTTSSEV